jgi:hypothetical protein
MGAFTILLGAAGAAEPSTPNMPVKGVVVNGRALVFLQGRVSGGWLQDVPLAGGPVHDSPKCVWVWQPPCVWQVADGYLWASGNDTYPPIISGGFQITGILDSLDRYQLDDLLDGKLIAGPGAYYGPAVFAFLDGGNSPLIATRQLPDKVKYGYFLAYDYLPTRKEEVLLFQLCNAAGADQPTESHHNEEEYRTPHWSLSVFRISNEWDAKIKGWSDVKGKFERVGLIADGFHERFNVLGKGDDYYFVTQSGKLYRAPKPDKGSDRKMDAVWKDDQRPIAAFITDADADRSFLFCKPDKDGKGVYFEMSDKPDPQSYDASKVPEAKPDDPLPAVLAYAKILVADKKIKNKD